MPLRETFDSVAGLYDAARPAYPEPLFDDLARLAELEPGARLLEIGCATGKATRPLLERGYAVVCVELGARLAGHTRRNLAGLPVEIHVAPFETWDAVALRRYLSERSYTADEYLALLDTFSGHIAMAAPKRKRLHGEITARIDARSDRRVRRHWHALLHVARRR